MNVALPWTPTLLEIKEKIEAVQGGYNYCLLNRYRSGADSMGWHADDEPEMGNVIGSLSLGATRTFRIRHNRTKETRTFPVGHGTLIVMAGTMQQFWKHEVPKTNENVGERINLTFRMIVKESASMPRVSAGLLMYRIHDGKLQVLLAHPGGPYFKNKDDGLGRFPRARSNRARTCSKPPSGSSRKKPASRQPVHSSL